ncbi:MAG: MarR family transcriptional regulator [Acidimicrobiia bacterium]|nr:MarR family transcriptional regulator [Acidimicrobiia bacterium]
MSIVGYDGVMAQGRADESAGLSSSSGYLLARLGAESRRRWARMLSERGLTPYHFGVLMALDEIGETYQQRLSATIGVDPRNAVTIFDVLEERKLIARASDQTDRRKRAVVLTAAGRAAVRDLRRAGVTLEQGMLAALTDREQTTLQRLLLKLFESTIDADLSTVAVPPKPADGPGS